MQSDFATAPLVATHPISRRSTAAPRLYQDKPNRSYWIGSREKMEPLVIGLGLTT